MLSDVFRALLIVTLLGSAACTGSVPSQSAHGGASSRTSPVISPAGHDS